MCMKIMVFWGVTSHSSLDRHEDFGGTFRFHLHDSEEDCTQQRNCRAGIKNACVWYLSARLYGNTPHTLYPSDQSLICSSIIQEKHIFWTQIFYTCGIHKSQLTARLPYLWMYCVSPLKPTHLKQEYMCLKLEVNSRFADQQIRLEKQVL